MGNPFAPRVGAPRRDSPEPFIRRLRILGATEEEITAVRKAWIDGYSAEEKRFVQGMSDPDIRRSLAEIRKEHYQATHTEEEEHADRVAVARETALGWSTPWDLDQVRAWAGDNPARIEALQQLERESAPPPVVVPDDLGLSLEDS